MDAERPSYKKWRFQAEGEPSRSTIWRRKKLKRKIQSHQEDELCYNEVSPHQRDSQDQDKTCNHHSRGSTFSSELQSETEILESMQTIQSDSSFSDQYCLGKRPFYSFKSQAGKTKHFSTVFYVMA